MDFLTNGFQQLFAELEDDIQENFKSYTCDITSSLSSPSTSPSLPSLTSSFNTRTTPITDTFEITTAYENNYLNEQNLLSLDFDWENQFLDNYIELPDFVNLLPEKTPLCNDSCNLFLKESSENLSKFRQTNDSINLNNEKRNKNEKNNNNESIKITFPCTWESCEKVYAKPAHLRAHLRRHLGDKPYICNWPNCTWRFSRSDELARHKRSHSGIKPFKCIYCPKCFARSDHLAKHRKVHERKMAASKIKGIYIPNLHQVRPGRKPKNGQYY
ncbi:Krueppel-like factor 6 [Condylostylus longicornis]|uniref:Krueppel-like factor 6 n=1 Tax=Condylostylus longicornis TaxID=2530218 RepID=UPI00244E4DC9|nr:Krueppel-like factor 6 [Condylostylus longicornis]